MTHFDLIKLSSRCHCLANTSRRIHYSCGGGWQSRLCSQTCSQFQCLMKLWCELWQQSYLNDASLMFFRSFISLQIPMCLYLRLRLSLVPARAAAKPFAYPQAHASPEACTRLLSAWLMLTVCIPFQSDFHYVRVCGVSDVSKTSGWMFVGRAWNYHCDKQMNWCDFGNYPNRVRATARADTCLYR